MAKLASMVYTITARTSSYERLNFQKTTSAEQKTTPRFSVTLGVVPDYLFGGPGLKIDGATEGRPAANAGMKAGDIGFENRVTLPLMISMPTWGPWAPSRRAIPPPSFTSVGMKR